jgi:hypothetical protein
MSQPTIIIEMRGGKVDAVYSSTDFSFLLIDRDNADSRGGATCEHFQPTLVKADLQKLYADEPEIAAELTTPSAPSPFY